MDPIGDVEGWHVDEAGMSAIDEILMRCIRDPVSPDFMAPPGARRVEQHVPTP